MFITREVNRNAERKSDYKIVQGGFVALGELAVLFVLGLPRYLMINKRHLAKQLKI